jgi:hypothetical protein
MSPEWSSYMQIDLKTINNSNVRNQLFDKSRFIFTNTSMHTSTLYEYSNLKEKLQ